MADGRSPGTPRVFASPLARRLAREAGLDLTLVAGTGPRARVVGRDVLAAQRGGAVQGEAQAEERGSLSTGGVRHSYLRGTAVVDQLLSLRAELGHAGRGDVTLDDLIGRAAAHAHEAVPAMTGVRDGESLAVVDLGAYGVEEFVAAVEPPHVATLALGAIGPEAAVVDGRVVVAQRIHVTLAVDHDAIEPAVAARWLRAFLDGLEHPLQLVL